MFEKIPPNFIEILLLQKEKLAWGREFKFFGKIPPNLKNIHPWLCMSQKYVII